MRSECRTAARCPGALSGVLACGYVLRETDSANGLVADIAPRGEPAGIAAVGFALAVWPMGVRRAGHCALSTVDTSLLLADMLTAAAFYDRDTEDELEIRSLADASIGESSGCGRAMAERRSPMDGSRKAASCPTDGKATTSVSAVCTRTGFIDASLPAASYAAWTSTYQWKEIYGYECIYRRSAVHPFEFIGYGENFRGLTASDGPGGLTRRIRGIERSFFDYVARGAPYGPDDGTIAPWAVVASLPFAPEIVFPAVRHLQDAYPQLTGEYCFRCSVNLTVVDEADPGAGWVSPYHFGINLGPVVLMCENYRSELLWRLMRACPYLVEGLRRAGFRNGWL